MRREFIIELHPGFDRDWPGVFDRHLDDAVSRVMGRCEYSVLDVQPLGIVNGLIHRFKAVCEFDSAVVGT